MRDLRGDIDPYAGELMIPLRLRPHSPRTHPAGAEPAGCRRAKPTASRRPESGRLGDPEPSTEAASSAKRHVSGLVFGESFGKTNFDTTPLISTVDVAETGRSLAVVFGLTPAAKHR